MRRTEDFIPSNALTSVVDLGPGTLRILAKARFALPQCWPRRRGEASRCPDHGGQVYARQSYGHQRASS
ncbi:hypothetical protein NHF46_01750 [Arthrobacter alpinus]|nr:hypothetical protein [Arthrobacter alpinus]